MTERFELLAALLKDVSRKFFELGKSVVDGHGLPPRSLIVMREILRSPGVTVSEISRQTAMAKSYVSKTVDNLVQAGFLEKRGDPADHRLVRVHPTAFALRHFDEVRAAVHRRTSAVISTLHPEKVEALIDGLQTFRAALERAERQRPGRPPGGDA